MDDSESIKRTEALARSVLAALEGASYHYGIGALAMVFKMLVRQYIEVNKHDPEHCKIFKDKAIDIVKTFIENEKI